LKLRDVIVAVLIPVLWGIGLVVAKPAVDVFPPILLMAFRFSLTALVMVWFVPVPRVHLASLFFAALIAATCQYTLTYNGLRYLDAGTTALIVQAEVPFLVLVAAVVLKEKIGTRQLLGMLIAFLGIYLLSGQPQLVGRWFAMALVLGGAFLWAVGQVIIRRFGDIGGLTVTAWLAVMASPQLFLMSFLLESNHWATVVSAKSEVWVAVIYMGIVMTAVGYSCWYHVLGRYEASRVGPFLLLTPLSSVVGGMLFLGEQMTTLTLIGGVIVMLGVGILVIKKQA